MIGSLLLSFALACSLFSMVMYYLNYRGYQNTLNFGRLGYHAMSLLVIAASTYLEYIILTHDYSFKYVYSYSSNELETGILAATFWAGQEGSFMLWVLLTSITGIILQSYTSKRGDLEPRVMAVFTVATTFLLVMVSPLFKSPFHSLWIETQFLSLDDLNQSMLSLPVLQNFLMTDSSSGQAFLKMSKELYASLTAAGISVSDLVINGKGLNPQLLNFWMQIHPPILFMGFAMATAPFAFAMAALMKNDYRDWVKQSFPWVLATAGVLGLGIMLGGYWAYEMLGWGGYWAWDPVENSSLIPWLVGVASVHTFLVQRKSQAKGGNGKFVKTNLMLSLLTYILVLYSTFLTRSGVLGDASVHSFVDPGMLVYLFLVIFIGSFTVMGVGMIAYRWKYLTELTQTEESTLSRDMALFTSAVVLGASALIVLLGTSAPLFGSSVETSFYNEMHLPIAIIIGVLNGLSLLLKWNSNKKEELMKKLMLPAGAAVIITALIAIIGGISDIMLILLILSAVFSIYINGELAIKIMKGNVKMMGAYITHIGLAVFILGVVGSAGFSDEVNLNLVKNVPVKAFGYEMMFTGYKPVENTNKYAFNIAMKKGDDNFNVAPVMYISDFNNSLVREPAIKVMPTKDFYISPMGYEETDGSGGNSTTATLDRTNSAEFQGVKFTFASFDFPENAMQAMQENKDFRIGVNLSAEYDGKKEDFAVAMINKNGQQELTSFDIKEKKVKVTLASLDASGKVNVQLASTDAGAVTQVKESKEVLTIQASIKPFIGLVWAGVLVCVIGFGFSVVRRLKESMV